MSYYFNPYLQALGTTSVAGGATASVTNCIPGAQGSSSAEAAKQAMRCAADVACSSAGVPPGICSQIAGPLINKTVEAWDNLTGVSKRRKRRELLKQGQAAVDQARAYARAAQDLMEADLDSTVAGLINFRRALVPSAKNESMGTSPVRKYIEIPNYGKVEYIQYADDNPMRARLAKAGVFTGDAHEFSAASLALTPPRVTSDPHVWTVDPLSPRAVNHLCVYHRRSDVQAIVAQVRQQLRNMGFTSAPDFFSAACQAPASPEHTHARTIYWRVNQIWDKFDRSLDAAETKVRNEIIAEAAREMAQAAKAQSEAQTAQAAKARTVRVEVAAKALKRAQASKSSAGVVAIGAAGLALAGLYVYKKRRA